MGVGMEKKLVDGCQYGKEVGIRVLAWKGSW